jgi:hypothetical protein
MSERYNPKTGYITFYGRCFPSPIGKCEELNRTLRYASETITRYDQLFLASICDAYTYLLHETTQQDLIYVRRQVRKLFYENLDVNKEGGE